MKATTLIAHLLQALYVSACLTEEELRDIRGHHGTLVRRQQRPSNRTRE